MLWYVHVGMGPGEGMPDHLCIIASLRKVGSLCFSTELYEEYLHRFQQVGLVYVVKLSVINATPDPSFSGTSFPGGEEPRLTFLRIAIKCSLYGSTHSWRWPAQLHQTSSICVHKCAGYQCQPTASGGDSRGASSPTFCPRAAPARVWPQVVWPSCLTHILQYERKVNINYGW